MERVLTQLDRILHKQDLSKESLYRYSKTYKRKWSIPQVIKHY